MRKLFWMFRALLYKPFMGRFGVMSYFGPPVFISGLSSLFFGEKVRIYPMSRIESIQGGQVIIGDDVSIGQCFHVIATDLVSIGEKSTISANVFISDVEHDYTEIGVHIMDQGLTTSETHIGNNCFVGYGAVIRAGTVLGEQCIVGANSVVKGVFPSNCVIAGNPAKVIKRYNKQSREWEKSKGMVS